MTSKQRAGLTLLLAGIMLLLAIEISRASGFNQDDVSRVIVSIGFVVCLWIGSYLFIKD